MLLLLFVSALLLLSPAIPSSASEFPVTGESNLPLRPPGKSLCSQLVEPAGYSCTEHTVQTKDGYLLGVQRVSGRNGNLRLHQGPPVLLQHGLFMGGDAWFLGTPQQSLGFILADQGFDVWVANVRGTFWSHGHTTLSERSKDFWEWSWQELAQYDLAEMINHVHTVTKSKVFLVGHSQGTIMSLAALTQPSVSQMVGAAALLCPISYLGHTTAPLVLRMVAVHLDQMVLAMGFHQLNFRSDILVNLLDSLCARNLECTDLLSSITGKNCCFNNSLVEHFLEYEPHPSSTKNLRHLFQMIRKDSFAQYDYGIFRNLRVYGQVKPPAFDLSLIPKSLPLWMGYGGQDALADLSDVQHTLRELQLKPELLYLENYGHLDFLLSTKGKEDVFNHMIEFFRSLENSSSS